MKLKLTLIFIYCVAILAPARMLAGSSQTTAGQNRGGIIALDLRGNKGIVPFNHSNHAGRINPDPNAPFKVLKTGAACSGCHHTIDPATGSPQLWKCTACHRNAGDPANPKGMDQNEQWSKTAFHNLCIKCHLASNKGPVRCGDCHQSKAGGTTVPGGPRTSMQ
ncbi:MAG TPA: cytochrome c3 family protein [Blastocatellia bacterium]